MQIAMPDRNEKNPAIKQTIDSGPALIGHGTTERILKQGKSQAITPEIINV